MPSMEIPWKEVFAPDSGTLLDVRVYDMTAADYDRLLGMLAMQYRVLYLEDGNAKAKDLPDYTTIIRRRDLVSVSIAIDVFGVEVKCFFWGENELTLDLRPEDVDSTEKAQAHIYLGLSICEKVWHEGNPKNGYHPSLWCISAVP